MDVLYSPNRIGDLIVTTEDENSTTITFSSSQCSKVFQLILSWETQAEPLAPESLVTWWKDEIANLYEMIYGEEE